MSTELIPGEIYKIDWVGNSFLFKCNYIEGLKYGGEVLNPDLSFNYKAFFVLGPNMNVTRLASTYCWHTYVEMPMFTSVCTVCSKCGEKK